MIKRTTAMVAGWLILVLLGLVSYGCSDEGVGATDAGTIQALPSQVSFSTVAVGTSAVETLTLRNSADAEALTIRDIELTAVEDSRIDELELIYVPDLPVSLESGEEIAVEVQYSPTAEAPANRGQILVDNSDPAFSEKPLDVPVLTLDNEPEFFAQPERVRFQRLSVGDSTEQSVRITNIGDAPMKIFEEPQYTGGEDFRITVPSREFPIELQPFDMIDAEESPEDYILNLDVLYQPLGDGGETGAIHVETNDFSDTPGAGDATGRHEIEIEADADSSCIEVDRRSRNFGQVPIGDVARDVVTVNNCGSETLEIYDVTLYEDEASVFRLDLGSWDQNGDGSVDEAVTLSPGESDTFIIEFIPVDEGTRRAEVIIFSNDSLQPELRLDVAARGAEGSCPEAVALATVRGTPMAPAASITAAPLEVVSLDGSESHDEDGDVVAWEWEVLESPPGTPVTLEPAPGAANDDAFRDLEVLTAGTYRIGLTVQDEAGFQSCEQAEVEITVIPDQNIHIELTWTNPEDPDESNDFGSDVDIHLVKMGPGAWFEAPYSIWYLNPNQDEDPIWNPENPSLDIDVTDGAGPENITMRDPDDCQWYAVGVHYFQKRFGTAYATIRIYINGGLRYERPYFPLEETGNFWDVARIHWDGQASNATIVDVDGFYPMTPAGEPPAVTNSMIDTGLCTAEGLY